MSSPTAASTTQVIANILANRATRQDEIPALIENVFAALTRIARPVAETPVPVPAQETIAKPARAVPKRGPGRPRRQQSEHAVSRAVDDAPASPRPAPTLLRRAEVVAPQAAVGSSFESPRGAVRGVVKWFDARSGRGALRLQGCSNDIPVESAMLAEAGIARLYKGQEIEAWIDGSGDTASLTRLSLPGGSAATPTTAGAGAGRRVKPVVVELKRQGLRRVAAREEAEQLLRPARPR